MAVQLKGNAVIGQSGGPTCVINQSLVGAIEAAHLVDAIQNFYGAREGVKGMLEENFIDLFKQPKDLLERVARTPGAALGSVRKKPTDDECHQLFEIFRRLDVRYFFYNGGNDTAETADIVNRMADDAGYELRIFHIPKTIDNDLMVTDHCPGYGTAAKFVAMAFLGDEADNRSLRGIKINVVMGRHAGFLTAASILARVEPGCGPHLVYVPEVDFDEKKFAQDVLKVYEERGRCVVVVSVGIHHSSGRTITQKTATQDESDSHGNVQLSGTGALADYLTNLLKQAADEKLRVRGDTFGYLQRTFPGVVSEVDSAEARMVGRDAVRYATAGDIDGSVALRRLGEGERYACDTFVAELSSVARVTKDLPAEYINAEKNNILDSFKDYVAPLAGPLPAVGYFD
ncbi:MAG: 6-phosphofructokinase [Planctomycetia bacterium]|nr:6-phosphofructokinase [Planctomycetia bacterium]